MLRLFHIRLHTQPFGRNRNKEWSQRPRGTSGPKLEQFHHDEQCQTIQNQPQPMTRDCQLLIEFLERQLQHAQKNGALTATYRVLEKFGLHYGSIRSTLDEAVRLGSLEITSDKGAHKTKYRLITRNPPSS